MYGDKSILNRESVVAQNASRKDMRNIDIREAHPDDADAMREVQHFTWLATYPNEAYGITREDIEARFRENPEMTEERRHFVNTAPFHSWVAVDRTDVIGFCTIKQDEHENLIQALYVLPDYQNKGVRKRLLQIVLGWFGDAKEVVLNVASYNEKRKDIHEPLNPNHSHVPTVEHPIPRATVSVACVGSQWRTLH